MFEELPKSTLVNRFYAKNKFYKNLMISNATKDEFVNDIDSITWMYKLSPDTIGINKTEETEEIEIFEIKLKNKIIPKNVIKTICKGVPYKLLFILKYNNDTCFSVKIDDIYNSTWNERIKFSFNALTLDILYQNIVKAIIKENDNENDFETIIVNKEKIDELNKKINNLKIKVNNEKQFNRRVEYNRELKKLLEELESIK